MRTQTVAAFINTITNALIRTQITMVAW